MKKSELKQIILEEMENVMRGEEHPELQPVVDKIADLVQRMIAKEVRDVESKMPYRANRSGYSTKGNLWVLKELIRVLEVS